MSLTKFSLTFLRAWRFPKRNDFFTLPSYYYQTHLHDLGDAPDLVVRGVGHVQEGGVPVASDRLPRPARALQQVHEGRVRVGELGQLRQRKAVPTAILGTLLNEGSD